MSVSAPAPEASAWPPPAPPEACACPRCKAPSNCAPEVQACTRCGGRFALHAGPLLEKALAVPEPDPQAKRVKVRSAGLILFHAGILEPDSIQEGTLDPVIGRLPMNSTVILYRHIYSVAFWRALSWGNAVANAFCWLLAGACGVGAFHEPGLLVMGIPLVLLAAWWSWRTYGVRRWQARVVGLKGTVIHVRFDKPWWNRRRFHDELLRRAGIPKAPMP